MPPPSYIKKGDIIIYNQNNCQDSKTLAMIVTMDSEDIRVTGNSPALRDKKYSFMNNNAYYEWLHFEDQ